MKINWDYYKNDVYYNKGKEEEKIIEYIKSNSPEMYEEIIEKDSSDEIILALSTLRNNIVYSYDFNPNAEILEIGAHFGEVTNLLCEKASKVISIESVKERAEAISKRCENKENLEIIVGNLKDIKLEEKFDYITLFGILEYAQNFFDTENPAAEMINYCKQFLKEDGKLLIATNNKFALKSYVGDIDECTNNTFDSITGYKSSKKTYKLGKNEIENILKNSGLKYYKFLYLLPDYKIPNVIFSDEYLPSSSKINAYFPYYKDDSYIFFSEVDAYDTIIKENKEMFKFFANSYFIEASKQEFNNDTRYVSFNNYRKKKYRLMTKIRKDIVEKTYTNEQSKQHIEEMKQNIELIKNEGIEVLDKYDNEKIISEFVNDKLLSQKISDNLENKQYIIDLLKRYRDELYSISTVYDEKEKTVFDKFLPEVDKEMVKCFHYLKNGYWDMIFKNCFLIDDKFVFFDQEWKEENVPAEFLVYRCIINIEKLRSKIQDYNLYEEMGINEYIDLFEKLDQKISSEIFDNKVFDLYTRKHINPIYENGKLKQELNAEKSKSAELEKSINNLSNEIYQKDDKIRNLEKSLNNIYESKAWKLIKGLNKLLNK